MSYATIADDVVRQTVRHRADMPHDDRITLRGATVCKVCGGVVYPLQSCRRCVPPLTLTSGGKSTELDRQREARINSEKTYVSLEPCKVCGGSVRFTVGQRCVPCITAAYANATDGDANVQAPMHTNLQHAPPTSHQWRKMVQQPKAVEPDIPAHPIADANRIAAEAAGEKLYDAFDWPCVKCGGTQRYTKFDKCFPCKVAANRARYQRHHATPAHPI